MEIVQAREAMTTFLQQALGKAACVLGVGKTEEGWKATAEVVEEKGLIDDVLGEYEVIMDKGQNIVSYQRTSLRRRSDLASRGRMREEE